MIFHIGFERTGTTSIQDYFYTNRDILSRQSILYPVQNLAVRHHNHIRLVASYLPGGPPDRFVTAGRHQNREIVTSIKQEIDANPASTIIISAEHFSSRFGEAQIKALAADFREFHCEAVMFVRGHASRLRSAYSAHIGSGGRATPSQFAAHMLCPTSLYCRYADTIALWENSFGRDNIRIALYNPAGYTPGEIAAGFGLGPTRLPPWHVPRRNMSLDRWQTRLLRRVNLALFPRDDGPAAPGPVALGMQAALCRACLRLPRRGRPSWSLDGGTLAALREIWRQDQRFLFENYGLHLGLDDERPNNMTYSQDDATL